jgi:hypothetical protein
LKSSPRDATFAGFVRRALDAIQPEVPWAHEGLRRALAGWTTLLVVDGEPATIRAGSPSGIAVAAERNAADVVCTTTSRTIIDLISGRETLLDAVVSDRLELIGGIDALLTWHEMLQLFLHGAVRARAFEGLLGEFRRRLQEPRSLA